MLKRPSRSCRPVVAVPPITENRAVIYENVNRYDSAAEKGAEAFPKFPRVLYLVPDVARRQQLRRWIGEVYDNKDGFFVVEADRGLSGFTSLNHLVRPALRQHGEQ